MHIVKIELLVYTTKVYILPFIMVVKILKLDNPKGRYAHLTNGVLQRYEMEKLAFKVSALSLGQWPIGPKIIKITLLRLQILISNFHSGRTTHKQ